MFRSKFRLKSDDDASKIWIRCAQNSLKTLEGAEDAIERPASVNPHHYPMGWDYWTLFTTGTQLVTTGTPLVTTGLTSLHWVTMGSTLVLLPLEHHWKHPWGNLL
jgi:hypothetical protein